MDIRKFVSDETAVSPVIGVILMVAITVILAAVIGTFVLGLGNQVGNTAPQAQFEIDYNKDAASLDWVNITHTGGDAIDRSELQVRIGSTTALLEDGTIDDETTIDSDTFRATGDKGVTQWPSTISAGDTLTIGEAVESSPSSPDITDGMDVRIVWSSPSGDSTQTLAKGTVSF